MVRIRPANGAPTRSRKGFNSPEESVMGQILPNGRVGLGGRNAVNRTVVGTEESRSLDKSPDSTRPRADVTPLDFWAFVLPAISFVQVTIVGQLIVTEILLFAMLPWLWSARDRLPLPRWFAVLWAGWLLGQIVTDFVVGSAFEDFARGWAAIVFTLTDFAAILILVSTPRRARLFVLGLALGGVFGYFFVPNLYAAGDPWKWAFAGPAGLALAAGLSGSTGARRPWLTVAAFAAFGVLNLYLGFRSLGGVSLMTAGYLILSAIVGRRPVAPKRTVLRAAFGLAFVAIATVGTLKLYDAAASAGLLGADARDKYESQSGEFGVLLGGRSEILVATQAAIDSPIFGHGSWAKDFTYVDLLADRRSSLGYEVGAGPSDVGLIPAHSYLMGSWVWAGFLGGVFWLAVVLIAVWLLTHLYTVHVELAALLVFSTMLLLWDIAFSPYGSGARLGALFGVALCLLGLRQMQGPGTDQPSPFAARNSK